MTKAPSFNEAVVRRRRRARSPAVRRGRPALLQRSRRPKTTESGSRPVFSASSGRLQRSRRPKTTERRRPSRRSSRTPRFNEAVVRRRRREPATFSRPTTIDGLQRSRRPKTTERWRSPPTSPRPQPLQRSRRPKTTERRPRSSIGANGSGCFNEAVVRRRRRGPMT